MGHRRGQLETVRDVLKLQARRRTRLGQLVPQRRLTRRPRIQRSQHRGAHHHRANCQHRARQTPAPPQPPNQQPTTSTRATHPHRSSGEGPARSGTALHAGRAAHPRGAQQARGSECGLTQHPSAAERCATAIEGGGPWAARLAWAAWGLSRPAVTAPRARPRSSSKRYCVTTRTAWRRDCGCRARWRGGHKLPLRSRRWHRGSGTHRCAGIPHCRGWCHDGRQRWSTADAPAYCEAE